MCEPAEFARPRAVLRNPARTRAWCSPYYLPTLHCSRRWQLCLSAPTIKSKRIRRWRRRRAARAARRTAVRPSSARCRSTTRRRRASRCPSTTAHRLHQTCPAASGRAACARTTTPASSATAKCAVAPSREYVRAVIFEPSSRNWPTIEAATWCAALNTEMCAREYAIFKPVRQMGGLVSPMHDLFFAAVTQIILHAPRAACVRCAVRRVALLVLLAPLRFRACTAAPALTHTRAHTLTHTQRAATQRQQQKRNFHAAFPIAWRQQRSVCERRGVCQHGRRGRCSQQTRHKRQRSPARACARKTHRGSA